MECVVLITKVKEWVCEKALYIKGFSVSELEVHCMKIVILSVRGNKSIKANMIVKWSDWMFFCFAGGCVVRFDDKGYVQFRIHCQFQLQHKMWQKRKASSFPMTLWWRFYTWLWWASWTSGLCRLGTGDQYLTNS